MEINENFLHKVATGFQDIALLYCTQIRVGARTTTNYWQSYEDHNWKVYFINVFVKTDTDTMMKIWDYLSWRLSKYLDEKYPELARDLRQSLSVVVTQDD